MTHAWVSLPKGWKLEDVQAVLNIIISLLSAVGIFIFTRLSWQIPAVRIALGSNVSLPSLLTLSSLGEAFDIVTLLKSRLLQPKYIKIHVQLLMLAIFSISAILSGPIARYSSRRAEIVSTQNVTGLLTNRWHNSIGYANVEWNLTQTSLDQAGFPLDQIPDFVPDVSIPWQYRSEEWNNTWSMTCDYTNFTPIALNVTNDGCDDLWQQIPDLANILRPDDWDYLFSNWDGYYSEGRYKDILVFLYGTYYDDYDEDTEITWEMTASIAALHLHNVSFPDSNYTGDCGFGAGSIEYSSYTKASCHLTRPKDTPVDYYSAFPDSGDIDSVPDAYTAYYQARFMTEAINEEKISIIMPRQLVRFFQTYIIVKDTQSRQPVSRLMSAEIQVVQLSTVFLAICVFVAFSIVVGLTLYTAYLLLYRGRRPRPPLSKLDWMIQSIEGRIQWHSPGEAPLRRSATSTLRHDLLALRQSDTQRTEFEHAVYGDSQQHHAASNLDSLEYKHLSHSSSPYSPQIGFSGPQPLVEGNLSDKSPGQSVSIYNRDADRIYQSPHAQSPLMTI